MYNDIMLKYPNHKNTCPIDNLEDGCITFVRNSKYLSLGGHRDVVVLVPKEIKNLPDGWRYEFVDNVDYVFTMIHNTLYKNVAPQENIIGQNCFIHPTAVLDVEGMVKAIQEQVGEDGRIKVKILKQIIGKTPSYPKQVVGNIALKKVFLVDCYELI